MKQEIVKTGSREDLRTMFTIDPEMQETSIVKVLGSNLAVSIRKFPSGQVKVAVFQRIRECTKCGKKEGI